MPQPLTLLVVPAKAGTQGRAHHSESLDPRFRGGDEQDITE
jgi:hypothetical protein